MAEIVQPLWWSACASTSSSHVSMEQGSLVVLVVVEDRQLRGSPTPDGGPHKVGNFSEQNWGDSGERDQPCRGSPSDEPLQLVQRPPHRRPRRRQLGKQRSDLCAFAGELGAGVEELALVV